MKKREGDPLRPARWTFPPGCVIVEAPENQSTGGGADGARPPVGRQNLRKWRAATAGCQIFHTSWWTGGIPCARLGPSQSKGGFLMDTQFQDRLNRLRRERGLSQEDLAEVVGVTRQAVQ